MRRHALAFLLTLSACAPTEIAIDARWRPLEKLERSGRAAPGVYWTLVPVVYSADLRDFTARSTLEQEGLLTHERLHAVRQLAEVRGPAEYLYRYATDWMYRKDEESFCWDAEIAYVVGHGGSVDSDYVARFLATNYGDRVHGPLWTYTEARAWVDASVRKARAP